MSKTWLITGGCGFIGVNLVNEIKDRGHRIRVMDNLSAGGREDLAAVTRFAGYEAGQEPPADPVVLMMGDVRRLSDVCRE